MMLRAILAIVLLIGTVFASNSYVFVVDGSSSMASRIDDTRKFTMVQDALYCALDSLEPGDEAAIFVFEDAGKVTLVKGFTKDKNALRSAARTMGSKFGSTALSEGLNVSAAYLRMYAANYGKFLILVSDGGGATVAIYPEAAQYHSTGITKIHVIGLNVDTMVKRGLALEGIATNGGGSFYSTTDYMFPCDAVKDAMKGTSVSTGKASDWYVIGALLLAAAVFIYASYQYFQQHI